jgi:YVTN family beta-propeller protein
MRGRVAALSFALAGLLLLAVPALASARFAYVTGDVDASDPFVTPVDLATNTAGSEIHLPGGGESGAGWLAITPDGKTAYVADSNTDQVVPIDLATNTAGTPIDVGAGPFAVAITPDGTRAYVTNQFDGSVTPIDLTTNTALTPIPVGSFPQGIAITPDGTRAYVANLGGGGSVSVIDLGSGTVIATLTGLTSVVGVAVTPDGSTVYASEGGGDTVPIPVATNVPGTAIAGGAGNAIAITPDGTRAFTADDSGGSSVPIDLAAASAGTPIPVGDFPQDIAIAPDGSKAYVTTPVFQAVDGVLVPVDLTTNVAASGIDVGEEPNGVAIVPNQGPHAAFSFSPNKQKVKKAVAFDGSGSTDSDGSVARYDWDFGDGTQAANGGSTPKHSYSKAGTYQVTLTTTDNEGCSLVIVFTGQTAYCNGSSAARVTHPVTVVKPKKKHHVPPCRPIRAGGSTFVPKIRPGPTVPGVRVKVFTGVLSQLNVRAALIWFKHGRQRGAHLRSLSVRVHRWRRVRFPIPRSLRGRFPIGSKVRVRLRIETHPVGAAARCVKVTHRTLHVRVVKVFPDAVQRGRLP